MRVNTGGSLLLALLLTIRLVAHAQFIKVVHSGWPTPDGRGSTTGAPSVATFKADVGLLVEDNSSIDFDPDNHFTFHSGQTQFNITIAWAAGSGDVQWDAFISTLPCDNPNSLSLSNAYRGSQGQQQLLQSLRRDTAANSVVQKFIHTVPYVADLDALQCVVLVSRDTLDGTQEVARGAVVPYEPDFPETFHAHVDVGITNKGYSFVMTESYDHTCNVVRIDVPNARGGRTTFVQDYDTEELYTMHHPNETYPDGICTVTPFTEVRLPQLLAFDGTSLAGTSKFLGFKDQDRTPQYVPHTAAANPLVRGVPVDTWTYDTAVTDAATGAQRTYTTNFQFSIPMWHFGRSTGLRNLRRIELLGNVTDGTTVRDVRHVYDYIDFSPEIPGWVSFNPCRILPRGVDCPCVELQCAERYQGSYERSVNDVKAAEAGFMIGGIVIGVVVTAALLLTVFYCCAGVTLCNMRGRGATVKNGTYQKQDLEMAAPTSPTSPVGIDVTAIRQDEQ